MDYPVKIAPEALEVANTYLTSGSLAKTAEQLGVSTDYVSEQLARREVRAYVDNVFLDQGYRNRFSLFNLLDEIIESKLEEARETEMFSNKDLMDIIQMAHRMKMEEVKATQAASAAPGGVNVQINNSPFGQGNYGNLIQELLCRKDTPGSSLPPL